MKQTHAIVLVLFALEVQANQDAWTDQQCAMLSGSISIKDAYMARQMGIDQGVGVMGLVMAVENGRMDPAYLEVAAGMVDLVYKAKPDEPLSSVALRARRYCAVELKKQLGPGRK